MKTILITGSTDGIGKLTALKMAEAGHQVFLHGRNKTKLEAARATMAAAYGFSDELAAAW